MVENDINNSEDIVDDIWRHALEFQKCFEETLILSAIRLRPVFAIKDGFSVQRGDKEIIRIRKYVRMSCAELIMEGVGIDLSTRASASPVPKCQKGTGGGNVRDVGRLDDGDEHCCCW